MSHPVESSFPATSAEAEPSAWATRSPSSASLTDARHQTLKRCLQASHWVSTGLVCLLLFLTPLTLIAVWNAEKGHRSCAADWVLWLVGSEKNVNEAITDALEKGRKDSPLGKTELESAIKPLEFPSEPFILSDALGYRPEK